jgi:hypothetical protein
MQVSRINQLRKARHDLEHKLQWDMANAAPWIDKLIDEVVEISHKYPLPASHPQSMAEMFEAQACAKYLFESNAYYLFNEGRVEDVYQCLNNPLVLSYGIAASFNHPTEDRYVAMGRKAIAMGGILTSHYTRNSSGLSDTQAWRAERVMPPLDIVKGTLVNQFLHEWAIEHDAHEFYRYSEFTSAIMGYVADEDPEWAIRFTLEHEDRFRDMFSGAHRPYDDHIKLMTSILSSSLTAKPFTELHRQNPEYFESLQYGSFLPQHIQSNLVHYPVFRLSEMPFIESVTEFHLGIFFLECAVKGVLTQDRLDDLSQTWTQYGFKGDMVTEVMKSKSTKNYLEFMKPYYAFINNEALTAEAILTCEGHSHINEHFDVLDALVKKPGKRLADSPVAQANHIAYLLAHTTVNTELCKTVMVTGTILEVCLRRIKKERNEDQNLLDYVNKALKNKQHHPEVAKLSYELVEIARQALPEISDELLRKINWQDRSIKAELLDDALGL